MALPFASMPIIPHCSTVCTSDMISDILSLSNGVVSLRVALLCSSSRCQLRQAWAERRHALDGVCSIPLQHVTRR